LPTELVTKGKPNITSVEVHPELSHNGHPLCWFTVASSSLYISASDSGGGRGGQSSATWRHKKKALSTRSTKACLEKNGPLPSHNEENKLEVAIIRLILVGGASQVQLIFSFAMSQFDWPITIFGLG